jgi:outer membrane lipoprotein carrier protein
MVKIVALSLLMTAPASVQDRAGKPVTGNRATAGKAAGILERVQATYESAGDIEARFEQVFVDQLRGKRRSEKGMLWAKPDGRVRWSYLDPIRKDFIYDGTTAYFYEPENAQVTVFERFQDSPLASAVQFLWGQGDIRASFTVETCKKQCDIGEPGDIILALWPKQEIPTVDHSLLAVDPKTYRVRRSFVYDPLGNHTEYRFDDIRFGANVTDRRFDFEVPKGANVLRSTADRVQ